MNGGFGSQRPEDGEFEASLGYIARSCLKKKHDKTNKSLYKMYIQIKQHQNINPVKSGQIILGTSKNDADGL
jgi:hypothetical protein